MNDTDTEQTGLKRNKKGQIIGGTPPAGFNKHPENISPGGWKKENTISYQYNRFLNMTPEELKAFSQTPDKERTVAMDIAYSRVLASRKSLPDVREITDRTEGKAAQAIDHTSSDGSMTPQVIIESVYANKPNFRPDNSPTEADDVAADSN
jgi:hypothetical protein